MFIHRVGIPGPTVIKYERVSVPVPYVIVKEVTVTVPVMKYVTVPVYLRPGETAPPTTTTEVPDTTEAEDFDLIASKGILT